MTFLLPLLSRPSTYIRPNPGRTSQHELQSDTELRHRVHSRSWQQLIDEVQLQAPRATQRDALTHRHMRIVISRSFGVLLDKEAAVVIPSEALYPTQFVGGEETSQETRKDRRGGGINLADKQICDTPVH